MVNMTLCLGKVENPWSRRTEKNRYSINHTQYPRWDSNWVPPEYKSEALLLELMWSVCLPHLRWQASRGFSQPLQIKEICWVISWAPNLCSFLSVHRSVSELSLISTLSIHFDLMHMDNLNFGLKVTYYCVTSILSDGYRLIVHGHVNSRYSEVWYMNTYQFIFRTMKS